MIIAEFFKVAIPMSWKILIAPLMLKMKDCYHAVVKTNMFLGDLLCNFPVKRANSESAHVATFLTAAAAEWRHQHQETFQVSSNILAQLQQKGLKSFSTADRSQSMWHFSSILHDVIRINSIIAQDVSWTAERWHGARSIVQCNMMDGLRFHMETATCETPATTKTLCAIHVKFPQFIMSLTSTNWPKVIKLWPIGVAPHVRELNSKLNAA
jgi:hypothetical protein